MEIVKREVDESPVLMSHISPEILAADDEPAVAELVFDFPFDDSCHFAVLLGLENPLHVRHLFDSRVRYANNFALHLRGHI